MVAEMWVVSALSLSAYWMQEKGLRRCRYSAWNASHISAERTSRLV